ncbi:MAG: gliding motility-associated ABC transporter substrate-binding protein GldG [Chitinophagales bacterium]|nr:gliding motility-associated ABC transporter substrate-binding protein GldG [Chitinophagales bacterium]
MVSRRSHKQQAFAQLFILIGIIILLNILLSSFFKRIDLTADKRFTLSDSSIKLLNDLKDVVFVKVYLKGEMPPGFQRLSTATMELLDEFKAYGGNRIQYQFIDPVYGKSESEITAVLKDFSRKGLMPTNVQQNAGDQYSEKIVVPGAIIYFNGKETPVQLLETNPNEGAQTSLNNSIAHLEHNFSQGIQKLSLIQLTKIGFIQGHGEIKDSRLGDLLNSISGFYQWQWIDLAATVNISSEFTTVIIAKPTQKFSEKDKYKLDQYIMQGGKVLWMIEPLNADIDSLMHKSSFITLDFPLNLDDQLFRYGVRINPDLIMDLQCNPVPLLVNYESQKPNFKLFPCFYFPVFTPDNNHLIVQNTNGISARFVSSIDTVAAKGIKKTVLLHSSGNSRNVFTPWLVDFADLKNRPDPKKYNRKNLPSAVLLEGIFPSIFINRFTPEALKLMDDSLKKPFKSTSEPTKMIVISDGDIGTNEVNKEGTPMPLGYDRYTGEYFDNKTFLLNCIDYLCGYTQHINTRIKTVTLRLLDTSKVREQKVQWQLTNTILPVALISVFGLIFNFIRRRKYARS